MYEIWRPRVYIDPVGQYWLPNFMGGLRPKETSCTEVCGYIGHVQHRLTVDKRGFMLDLMIETHPGRSYCQPEPTWCCRIIPAYIAPCFNLSDRIPPPGIQSITLGTAQNVGSCRYIRTAEISVDCPELALCIYCAREVFGIPPVD